MVAGTEPKFQHDYQGKLALPSEQAMEFDVPFALSRDGSRIAYHGVGGRAWIRELNRLEATRLPEIDMPAARSSRRMAPGSAPLRRTPGT